MDTAETLRQVEALASALVKKGWTLATAESCTGGLIAAACTELAGSSAWFDRGFVTYSNESKIDLLGVPANLIDRHGAVSEAVARAMVQGALARSSADVAVAVTGIAGPTGGTPDKPVGSVWMAWGARHGAIQTELTVFTGGREEVRQATVFKALRRLTELA